MYSIVVSRCQCPDTLMQGVKVWGTLQRERSEQLRSLSSVAGVMNGFAMSSLLQLNFDDRSVPYDGPASCGYAFTLGLTARPCLLRVCRPSKQMCSHDD